MKIAVTCRPFMGDIVNTWSALELLKLVIPHATIEFFNKPAFKDVVLKCPWVDRFVNIDTRNYKGGYDISVMFNHNGWMVRDWINVKTHVRVISSDKQLDYPAMILLQLKHLCEKPEHRYNIELVTALLERLRFDVPDFTPSTILQNNEIIKDRITIHPVNGTSAAMVTEESLVELAIAINNTLPEAVLQITKVGKHDNAADTVFRELVKRGINAELVSVDTIDELDTALSKTSIFIAGSTGPLHYAGMCGITTIGLYPDLQYDNLVRWSPPGKKHHGLVFDTETKSLTTYNFSTIIDFIKDL